MSSRGTERRASGRGTPAAAGRTIEGTEARLEAPDPDEIARLAYQLFEQRGGLGGTPEDDWYRAEEELRRRTPARKPEVTVA